MSNSVVNFDLARRRWLEFKKNRRAFVALFLLGVVAFFSVTATFWANSQPLLLRFNGAWYVPFLQNYHPSEFGQEGTLVTNYKNLPLRSDDVIVWPLIPWDPYEYNKNIASYPGSPSQENWLGTDDRGRDVLSRLLYGFRYSVFFAVLVWVLSFSIGTVVGGAMGYFGNRVDLIGQRIVEVLNSVPQFFLLIIVVSIFQPGLFLLVALSSAFGWIFISYYVRAEFLKLRTRDYVEAARALGARRWRVLWAHILPNSLGPVFTFSPFVIASNVVSLAALDFLGFGLPPPTPSWGELLSQAQRYIGVSWWLALYPSLALFLTLIAFTMIGEGVRDAFDPQNQR